MHASEPSTEVVSLPFSRLRHLCRFEKGGYCKKIRGACKPQKLPPNPKTGIKTIKNQIIQHL